MNILDIIKFVPLVTEALKSKSYSKPAAQAAQAQIDPNSAMFQNLYGAEKQQGQNDLAFQIAELQRQNRKSSMMGRTPLFSAERGGEQLFRGLTQGYQNNQDNARKTTFDRLSAGAQNLASTGEMQRQGGLYGAAGIGSAVDTLRGQMQPSFGFNQGGQGQQTITQAFQPQGGNDLVAQLKGLFNLA